MRFGIRGVLKRKHIWPNRFFTAWLQLAFGEIKSHLLSIRPASYASLMNLKLCCTDFGSAHLLKVARHTLVRWYAFLLMKSTHGVIWTSNMHFLLSSPYFVPSEPWGFGSFCGDSLYGLFGYHATRWPSIMTHDTLIMLTNLFGSDSENMLAWHGLSISLLSPRIGSRPPKYWQNLMPSGDTT